MSSPGHSRPRKEGDETAPEDTEPPQKHTTLPSPSEASVPEESVTTKESAKEVIKLQDTRYMSQEEKDRKDAIKKRFENFRTCALADVVTFKRDIKLPSIPDRSGRPKAQSGPGTKPSEVLRDFLARKRRESGKQPEQEVVYHQILDPYEASIECAGLKRGLTGITFHEQMLSHKCEWDPNHPEKPARLFYCLEKCYDRGLLALCTIVPDPFRSDLLEKIAAVHSNEHYEKLQKICQLHTDDEREQVAATYDSVFFNKNTFKAALQAVSSTLNLVFAIARGEFMNGMAFVRPPGHHAMKTEFNGYCFFNNVAIAAEAIIKQGLAKKILIVDFDVHHGQGTQQAFYDRDDVLYFSIHRYEHGCFWPYLKESNFNYIGKGKGLGYNINVPLNTTGLTDSDYIAIITQILMPVGYEYDPDLVIVSAGYDAVIGCPEGRMNVTPGFYSHVIQLLHGLARGKMAVVLEGGYFLPTLSEGVYNTLKTLLGGPCPVLEPVQYINPTVIESILNVKRMLHGKWKCFDICDALESSSASDGSHEYIICYWGEPDVPPFATRQCYPENTYLGCMYYSRLNEALQEKYLEPIHLPVKYVFDKVMLKHKPQTDDERPERPARLSAILNVFDKFGISDRLQQTQITDHEWEQYSPHVKGHFKKINKNLPQQNDLYSNDWTQEAVRNGINGLLTLADELVAGTCRSGIGVIRPPGHHAEYDKPMGFCFVNNVAVLANYFHTKYQLQRILIVDFDVHHGNGTQNLFYTSPHVLYVSVHKDSHGKFFPTNSPRSVEHDGHGPGKGYNINIPFNDAVMGDTEYMAVFHNIVMPVAYSYCPEVVIVSAGFDAGVHDPLGGYKVHPETFGHMILMLKALAGGKMILALEGGYNVTTTSYAMALCAKALLGDPIIMPKGLVEKIADPAKQTIKEVTTHFLRFYNIFACNRPLPNVGVLVKKVSNFTADKYAENLTKTLPSDSVVDNDYIEHEMRGLNLNGDEN